MILFLHFWSYKTLIRGHINRPYHTALPRPRRKENKPVLVIRVLLHVQGPKSLRLINKRPLLLLRKGFPFSAQSFGNFRVVHLWIFLCHFTSLTSRPDHERVHGSFHPVGIIFVVRAPFVATTFDVVVVRRGRGWTPWPVWQCGWILGQLCVMVVVAQMLMTHLVVWRRWRRGWGQICVTITRINGRWGTSKVMVTPSTCCKGSQWC